MLKSREQLIELASTVVKTKLPLRLVLSHLGEELSQKDEEVMENIIQVTLEVRRRFHFEQIDVGACP